MNGEEALQAFTLAAQLVKEGKYEEARAVELLESDRKVIEDKIARSGANSNDTKENK